MVLQYCEYKENTNIQVFLGPSKTPTYIFHRLNLFMLFPIYQQEKPPYPTNLSSLILSGLLLKLSIVFLSKSLMKFCLFLVTSSVNPHTQETKLLLLDSPKFSSIISNNTTPKTASGHSVISLEVILLLLSNFAINISLSL